MNGNMSNWTTIGAGCVLGGLSLLYFKPEIQRWWSRRNEGPNSIPEAAGNPTETTPLVSDSRSSNSRSVTFALDQTKFYSPRPSVSSPATDSSPAQHSGKEVIVSERPTAALPHKLTETEKDIQRLMEKIRDGRQLEVLLDELNDLITVVGPTEIGRVPDETTGRTVLHECAAHLAAGQEELIRILIQRASEFELDVDAADTSSGGMTALHLACAIGKERVAEEFIKIVPVSSLIKTNPTGWSCVHFVVAKDRPALLEKLIQRLRHIETKTTASDLLNLSIPSVGTALHLGMKVKAVKCCMMLLDQVSERLVDLEVLLPITLSHTIHLSVANGFPFYAVTSKILDIDLNAVDRVDRDGRTPLHVALKHGHGRVSLLLLSKGANPFRGDALNGVTPLHLVASANDLGLLQVILDDTKGVDDMNLEVTDVASRTPLIAAAIHGSAKTARLLLERGAKVDSQGDDTASALHWALKNKHKATAMVLLEFEASVAFRDSHGNTPLMIACYNGKPFASVAETILDKNPNAVNIPDSSGRYPLHWVAAKGHSQLCTALLDAGASSMVATKGEGIYPMHWAAQQAQFDTVEMLYYDGVNTQEISEDRVINVEDSAGRTPLHWLSQRLNDDELRSSTFTSDHFIEENPSGDFEPLSMVQTTRVLKFLLDHGADLDRTIPGKGEESSPRNILKSANLEDMLPVHAERDADSGADNFAAFPDAGDSSCVNEFTAFGSEESDKSSIKEGFATNIHESEPLRFRGRRRGTAFPQMSDGSESGDS